MRLPRTAVKVCASRQDRLDLEPAGRRNNAARSNGTVIQYLASLWKLIFGRPPTARTIAVRCRAANFAHSRVPVSERRCLFRRR
jgi:hypothetical protein